MLLWDKDGNYYDSMTIVLLKNKLLKEKRKKTKYNKT